MRYVTILLSFASLSACAQLDLEAERRAMLNGDVHGVVQRIEQALQHLHKATPTLEHARLLEMLGEQYHRLSDIGHAKQFWDEALELRQQNFGDSSAEAAVGYAYRARYHNYMGAPQQEHQPLAWRVAEMAVRLSAGASVNVSAFEHVLIQREAGYAYKVANGYHGTNLHLALGTTRNFYQRAMRYAISAHDTVAMAQMAHDIGNTYTDEVGFYKTRWHPSRHRALVNSALHNYRSSILLMQKYGMANSEAVMMDHFTTALVYYYAYDHDSIALVTAAYDRALRTMLVQAGHAPDVDPFTFDPRLSNKAQMIELLTLRANALANYKQEEGTRLLPEALQTLEAAVPYWEAMLRDYQSLDFHKVVGSYNHFPFQLGTRVLADLYRSTGEERYLNQALQWFDLDRNALEQREVLRTVQREQSKAKILEPIGGQRTRPGHACVALHGYHHLVAFIISTENAGLRILDSAIWKGLEPWHAANELREAMRTNDPQRYRRNAFLLYKATLAQALSDPGVAQITVIPCEGLENIPFEALVTDTLGPAQWGSLHYVNQRCAIRYARTIREALLSPGEIDLRSLRAAIALAKGTSELPFSTSLVQRLNSGRNFSVTRKELFHLLNGTSPVHFASHAVSPRTADGVPYFELSDGPLFLHEVDSAHCRAPFVVLSTCSSGAGPHYSGAGTLSLGHALLRNGSHAVVQTLWPVDDEATSAVLARMYEALDNGHGAADALALAKRGFITEHQNDPLSNPLYWSGIVLTGRDMAPLPSGRIWMWAAICGCSLLLIGGVCYRSFKRSRRSRALEASNASSEAATTTSP